jgi:hypothetical protein
MTKHGGLNRDDENNGDNFIGNIVKHDYCDWRDRSDFYAAAAKHERLEG